VTLNTAFAVTDTSNDTLLAIWCVAGWVKSLAASAVTAASTQDHCKEQVALCNKRPKMMFTSFPNGGIHCQQ